MKTFKEFLTEEDDERLAAGALFYALDTNKYGLALRSKICDTPHTYSPVGGSSDTNDKDLIDTVMREVKEEIGCDITRNQLYHVYVDRSRQNFQYHTFLCIIPKQSDLKPELNDENERFDWFAKNEMPKNLHPGFAKMFKETRKKLP